MRGFNYDTDAKSFKRYVYSSLTKCTLQKTKVKYDLGRGLYKMISIDILSEDIIAKFQSRTQLKTTFSESVHTIKENRLKQYQHECILIL